jgi:N-acetylglutamate synthase-like GNAT family acetyltransferase
MKIISIRQAPEYKDQAISYFQKCWKGVWPIIYEDCISHAIDSRSPLPQWYLLEKNHEIIGGAGLITNDFVSRMDLYPWICAVYIEEHHRGHAYGALLLEQAKTDARAGGFDSVFLCTDHIGYYEKYGFSYIGQGYHPWRDESRVYGCRLK